MDVQLTASAVRHARIDSTPVAAVLRVAAVAAGSDLDGATHVPAEDFLDRPLLHDPSLPAEFMGPFWLADMRPAAQAHLVGIDAPDSGAVLEHVARSAGATVLLASQVRGIRAGVRLLPLVGVAPLTLHAATRVSDRRSAVHCLVAVLRSVPLAGAERFLRSPG